MLYETRCLQNFVCRLIMATVYLPVLTTSSLWLQSKQLAGANSVPLISLFSASCLSILIWKYFSVLRIKRSCSFHLVYLVSHCLLLLAESGDGHRWDGARPAAREARARERRGGWRRWRWGDGGQSRGLEFVFWGEAWTDAPTDVQLNRC